MKIENWLYFRTVDDEDNDDGKLGSDNVSPTSICIPASAVKQIVPETSSSVVLEIDSCVAFDETNSSQRTQFNGRDHLTLNVVAGEVQEVMQALSEAISGTPKSGSGFIVVADDVITNKANESVPARYLHPSINSCGTLSVFKTPQGFGMHSYYEIVTPSLTADAAGEVAASLNINLNSQCILIEASLMVIEKSDHADASAALFFHNAAIADNASSAGTEWVGAGSAGTVSIPDADLNFGSGDTIYDTLHSGTHPPIDRAGAVTHFTLVAQEALDGASATAGKIAVHIKWWGRSAVPLIN